MSVDLFDDTDWDDFLKNQKGIPGGMTVGTWGSATPTPGSDVANEGWFNPGTPGSLTAAINAQNPTADPDKPYAQFGNTGGYDARSNQVTIGPGRSIAPANYVDMYNKAVEQYGKGTVDEWENRNPWDINRITEALGSEVTGGGQHTDGGPSNASPWAALSGGSGSGQTWGGENWFDDPATSQLETLIKGQLNQMSNPAANDPQAKLMEFLMTRFQELAGSNGYSPQELAMLNTQALEPIEALRKSAQQNELQRTAQRGFLPTSGLTRLNQQENDLQYDRMRTQANRDLAVQNVNERSNRLNQATQLGSLALQTQRGTGDKQLQLSTLLQQLPVQAMQQALSVLGGSTSPESLLSLVNQMTAQSNQQNYYDQQRTAQMWQAIGSMIPSLFR